MQATRFFGALLAGALSAACGSSSTTSGPQLGTVSGAVTSSMGGGLTGLRVVVTGGVGGALPAVTTTSGGHYSVRSVPLGPGSVSVTGQQSLCTFPDTAQFTLFGDSVTANVVVSCHGAVGYLAGNAIDHVTDNWIAGSITITPAGQAALPRDSVSGPFVAPVPIPLANAVAGIATGTVVFTSASLPLGCTARAPVPFNGLGNGDTITVTIEPTCIAGTLNLDISTVPGVLPVVTLSGPPASNIVPTPYYSATQTLAGIAPGTYTATLWPRLVTYAFDTVVGTYALGTLAGSPALVPPGGRATITVSYVARQGSGQIWLASGLGASAYPPKSLRNGVTSGRTIAIGAGVPRAIAFDTSGNLWLTAGSDVIEYAVSTLPLTSGSYTSPSAATRAFALPGAGAAASGLAFDHAGNLWVSDVHNAKIYEFAPGSSVPRVTIGSTGPSGTTTYLQAPFRLALDQEGLLWVADTAAYAVLGYTPTQLASSGSPVPVAISTATAFPGGGPYGMAFNANDDLYIGGASAEGPPGEDSTLIAWIVWNSYPRGPDSVPHLLGGFPAAPFPAGGRPSSPPVLDLALDASGSQLWTLGNSSLIVFTDTTGRPPLSATSVANLPDETAIAFDVTGQAGPLIGGASHAAPHQPVSSSGRAVRRLGVRHSTHGDHDAVHGARKGKPGQ